MESDEKTQHMISFDFQGDVENLIAWVRIMNSDTVSINEQVLSNFKYEGEAYLFE